MAGRVAIDAHDPLLARPASGGGGTCRSEVLSRPQSSCSTRSALLHPESPQDAAGRSPAAVSCRISQVDPADKAIASPDTCFGSSRGSQSRTKFEASAEPGVAADSTIRPRSRLQSEVSRAPSEPPCEEDRLDTLEVDEQLCGAKCKPKLSGKPKLSLPLLRRRDATAERLSPTSDANFLPTTLPLLSAMEAPRLAGPGSRRTPAALRPGRQLPARLQALDDQTVMPRDVYDNMLKLGDRARGRLGYGQHKLTFVGPEGAPVLRLAA